MNRIEVLDDQTIDKIAAGEVVERPASVVKELTENAIDAQATAITIEITDGGISLIRITDNGGGIPASDIRKAFMRHATSKIRKAEDLFLIGSLGFRGEALSSVAAVARVECITKTPEALMGSLYRIEGGKEEGLEEIGAPPGTTIVVRDLFYNVPARAKFLKSPQAEGTRVTSFVEELALSHPEISFKYILNGKTRLFTNGNGRIKEIIYQIYGRFLTKELQPISLDQPELKLKGFLGSPAAAKGNRTGENYFVNGRYIKSSTIDKAIEDGYRGFLMQHRYPFVLLYLEIPTEQVDVNVHPAKLEVRFADSDRLYRRIVLAIQNTLLRKEQIPEVHLKQETKEEKAGTSVPQNAPEPFEIKRREQLFSGRKHPDVKTRSGTESENRPNAQTRSGTESENRPDADPEKNLPDFIPDRSDPEVSGNSFFDHLRESGEYLHQAPMPRQTTFDFSLPENKTSAVPQKTHHLIGQLFDTYWLIEYDDSLYIIDQHAAHEKILYERLMRDFRKKRIHEQMLLPAITMELTSRESSFLQENAEKFKALGFSIEPFGEKSWKITTVPANLYGIDAQQLFRQILDSLGTASPLTPDAITERLAAMSCKAAVKGGDALSMGEANALIAELLKLENPYHCPHGRPTIIRMSRRELEKKFRRIL